MSVKSYDIESLVETTSEMIDEVEQVLEIEKNHNDLIDAVWKSSQPLFNFYKAMKLAKREGGITIKADEVFKKID